MPSTDSNSAQGSLTNYVAYHDRRIGKDTVGHYDLEKGTIVPLSFISGTHVENIYQVIEVGESNIICASQPQPARSLKILPPFPDRDVLCVGKNYAEHAKEFNSSGFDSSDKVDTPSHPVIFTKRFTSIIAHCDKIYPHPDFSRTVDYEGEIGVVIGKSGYRISEADAMDHVWGYTIINDITARERQRDHKQFYIGKSADTFCPMGPIAVPKERLDEVLRVQTHVNGELRQDATTNDLIFSIPFLIKTMSEGQTLLPGDVLATGTPAGVGIGRKPPVYLKAGDEVSVSINGLGTLVNEVANPHLGKPKVEDISHMRTTHTVDKYKPSTLTLINGKPLYYTKSDSGTDRPPVVLLHGLGGSNDYFEPLIYALKLRERHTLHAFDFEGHGLSPTSPLSKISVESLAEDLNGIFEHAKITSKAIIVAHGISCLVAMSFNLAHPELVAKLVLLGPPPSPLPDLKRLNMGSGVHSARASGMLPVAKMDSISGTSRRTQETNPLANTAIKMSLLSQDAEGYAKALQALVDAKELDVGAIEAKTLIITGSEDEHSPPQTCEAYVAAMKNASVQVLQDVGHWHLFEDCSGVANAMEHFLEEN
ncbi:hypothetical protein HBH69_066170 [Parastagonospora nodorum]|nr:hypothetical protein HBI09_014340 [Parastagonospora nodorum]KAH4058621.1 hypothetical protein HBH49_035560 [Parastagonospora nodorum]KAH4177710.1 hypothetical protein HBH43_035290 [Parastagonospora nodorum]KAH4271456.1 hypothetical protein HBI03_038480 [Parastagonospora nodorum]KAH4282573.1 hypothetical protein HBI04_033340 [Parastagonospora nodorum]